MEYVIRLRRERLHPNRASRYDSDNPLAALLIAIALSFITNFPDYFIARRFGRIRISEVIMKLCTTMITGLLLVTLLGCATPSRSDSVTGKNETRGLPGAMHGAHETNTPTSQPPGSGLTKAN